MRIALRHAPSPVNSTQLAGPPPQRLAACFSARSGSKLSCWLCFTIDTGPPYGRTIRCRTQSTLRSGRGERKQYRYLELPDCCRSRGAPRPPQRLWWTCPRKRPRRTKISSSARKSFPTSACRPSMSSTKRLRRRSLAIRSLGGAAAAVVVAGAAAVLRAAAAGAVAAAVVAAAAAAAGNGVVAATAKSRPPLKSHNKNPGHVLGDRGHFASCVTPNWEDHGDRSSNPRPKSMLVPPDHTAAHLRVVTDRRAPRPAEKNP